MSTEVHKNQMHSVYTGEFLSRLCEGIKVVFDAVRECEAPFSFTLPLSDAMSALDAAISICKLHVVE